MVKKGNYRRITPEEMKAIQYSISRARDLQNIFPEIAEDYRSGRTISQIINDYDIVALFNCQGEKIADSIVRSSLVGNNNRHISPNFSGLLDEEEYREISRIHQVENGKRRVKILRREKRGIFGMRLQERGRAGSLSGFKNYQNGTGMFSRTYEQIIKDSQLGGKRAYELGVGIHAMSSKEKQEAGRKGGPLGGKRGVETQRKLGIGLFGLTPRQRSQSAKKSVVSRGLVPWEDKEIECALVLSKMDKFRNKSQINNKKIAEEINRLWHDGKKVRNNNAVGCVIRRN